MIDRLAVDLCDPLQFDDVQPAFSQLTFGDERVRFAHAFRNIFLKIASIVACFYQTFQERLVSSLICRIAFVHPLRLRDY